MFNNTCDVVVCGCSAFRRAIVVASIVGYCYVSFQNWSCMRYLNKNFTGNPFEYSVKTNKKMLKVKFANLLTVFKMNLKRANVLHISFFRV